jgi:hypothetical protein
MFLLYDKKDILRNTLQLCGNYYWFSTSAIQIALNSLYLFKYNEDITTVWGNNYKGVQNATILIGTYFLSNRTRQNCEPDVQRPRGQKRRRQGLKIFRDHNRRRAYVRPDDNPLVQQLLRRLLAKKRCLRYRRRQKRFLQVHQLLSRRRPIPDLAHPILERAHDV